MHVQSRATFAVRWRRRTPSNGPARSFVRRRTGSDARAFARRCHTAAQPDTHARRGSGRQPPPLAPTTAPLRGSPPRRSVRRGPRPSRPGCGWTAAPKPSPRRWDSGTSRGPARVGRWQRSRTAESPHPSGCTRRRRSRRIARPVRHDRSWPRPRRCAPVPPWRPLGRPPRLRSDPVARPSGGSRSPRASHEGGAVQ